MKSLATAGLILTQFGLEVLMAGADSASRPDL
jgi:hypothetical protein